MGKYTEQDVDMETIEQIDTILNLIEKIQTAIAEDEAISALSETDLLLKILDDEYKKKNKLDKIQKKITHFLTNPNNSRMLRLQQRLKREIDTAIEYYDEDIGNDHRLFYQKEMEEDIIALYDEIRTAMATIIRNKLSGDISF